MPKTSPALDRLCDRRAAARAVAAIHVTLLLAALPAGAASLLASHASLDRQNQEARRHGFTFLQTPAQVLAYVDQGYLVSVPGNADYRLKEVSFPYARPEVRTFVEDIAADYRSTCGEQLIVTSLTRPKSRQPRNASPRSVHPTGMALDLRRSWNRNCRRWLEKTLLYLEYQGVIEAGYESRPPHFHVAVFPRPFQEYLAALDDGGPLVDPEQYVVTAGDTLWKIASRHATTVELVKAVNDLRSNRIYPGQILKVPGTR